MANIDIFLPKGKSFVAMMIVIAVFALLLRLITVHLIKINNEQNESNAQTTLKLISIALENFAKDNNGVFPSKFSVLTQNASRYLDKDYVSLSPIKGYNYSCLRLEPSGYSCVATPQSCKLTGAMSYSVTTGGMFIAEKCGKKE